MPLAAGGPPRLSEVLEALSAAAEAARTLGLAAGVAISIAALAALTVAWRFGRLLAALGGAAVGVLGALAAHEAIRVHLGIAPAIGAAIGAAAVGLACARSPRLFPFAAGALGGAFLGAALPLGGRGALWAAAGGLLGGFASLMAGRTVAASFASAIGGVLLPVGLVAIFGGHSLAREAAGRPAALLAVAVVAAIAGAAFQIGREEPPPPPPISPRDLGEQG